jgi:hypothetical protein
MLPEDLDGLILACCRPEWRKVAFVVANVGQSLKGAADTEYATIAARTGMLVEAGKLEVQGDFDDWRASEVRLLP